MTKEISRREAIRLIALTVTGALVGCNTRQSNWADSGGQEAYKTAAPTATQAANLPTGTPEPVQGIAGIIQVPEDFVFIKGGTFNMGSPETEAWRGEDEVEHAVAVSDFYISKYEVTQREYKEIMGNNPSTFVGDTLQVDSVTWFDAILFCNARSEREGLVPAYRIEGQQVSWDHSANGYRLATEAEWEYAARAGTTTPITRWNFKQTQADRLPAVYGSIGVGAGMILRNIYAAPIVRLLRPITAALILVFDWF